MKEGLGNGHEEKYYRTTSQTFLGEEEFIENVARRVEEKGIEPFRPRVRFEQLVGAVAEDTGISEDDLKGNGRQRRWLEARRLLVYLARQWSGMTTQALGHRLGRDPSMISRLHGQYEKDWSRSKENKSARSLTVKVQTQA
jgi:chromosomal replication initiation ATPase DnaA